MPINIIFDCIKELFMLVITLCTVCFFRAKINKSLAPLLLELALLLWILWRRHWKVATLLYIYYVIVIVVMVLPDPFRGMGARKNFAETQKT